MKHFCSIIDMKRILFALIALLLPVASTLAAWDVDIALLPTPETPISELGEYKAPIGKMDALIKENKLLEFYIEADKFFRKNSKDRREDSRSWARTHEEAMAMEWACRFAIMTPPLSDEIFLEPAASAMKDALERIDWNLKGEAFNVIIAEKFSASSISIRVYQRKHNMDTEPEIFPKKTEAKISRQLAYLALLTQSINRHRIEANEKLDHLRPKRSWEDDTDTILRADGTVDHEASSKAMAEANERYGQAMARYRILSDRLGGAIYTEPDAGTKLLYRLVYTFPRDGASVRKYLRMAGYTDDDACAAVIATAFPKTKETAYLYEGLKIKGSE
jgi:hypothetical protein